eukprot:TRINITY_DN63618_c0_g1_i1.p1 TRINITY_DN63618_c0_g1~~TRINITY_DN63618_c0_g1_i1.p1  ORF type:complete len:463 (-),score=59.94 TRINITY_DN63618_c0_g1_i1:239-1627(-)
MAVFCQRMRPTRPLPLVLFVVALCWCSRCTPSGFILSRCRGWSALFQPCLKRRSAQETHRFRRTFAIAASPSESDQFRDDDAFDELLGGDLSGGGVDVGDDVDRLLGSLRRQALDVWSDEGGSALLESGTSTEEHEFHADAFATKILAESFGKVLTRRWDKEKTSLQGVVPEDITAEPEVERLDKKDAPAAEDLRGQEALAQAQRLQSSLSRANARDGKPQTLWLGAEDKSAEVRIRAAPAPECNGTVIDERLYENLYPHVASKFVRCVVDDFASLRECRDICGLCVRGMHGLVKAGGQTSVVVSRASLEGLELGNWTDDIYSLIDRVRRRIITDMELPEDDDGGGRSLHTSAAMLTRLQPSGKSNRVPYWVPHVDKANVASYDYSALLYLNNKGEHFNGGDFAFLDAREDLIVEPRRGRLLTFTSGLENLHQVQRVTGGTRFVLAMWFTLSAKHADLDNDM